MVGARAISWRARAAAARPPQGPAKVIPPTASSRQVSRSLRPPPSRSSRHHPLTLTHNLTLLTSRPRSCSLGTSNITSYYIERAERLRVPQPQLHGVRYTMARTKQALATALAIAKAKENPNALPDRIELLLDDNYATRMVSVSPRPSPSPNPNPSPSPSPSPSPNSNLGQLCGSSTYDEVPTSAGTDAVVGDAFGLDGRVGAPLLRLSTPSPPGLSSPLVSLHLPPPPASHAPAFTLTLGSASASAPVSVSVGVGVGADIDVAPGACGAGPAHLRCAMRHLLCKYRFVGMTSRLNESACVLNSLFGWTQRPVPHSHETNSRADRVLN